ncbi:glycerophosphodiester phosphodiesterase family protein [Dermatophilaceae bacterium Soc4.6]
MDDLVPRRGPWAPARPGRLGSLGVQGHRGAKGLVVENTVPSVLAALDAGVQGIEIDVRLTADGEVVVWHDATLLPHKVVAPHDGLVGARVNLLTYDEISSVDVGSLTLPGFPRQQAAPGARISTLPDLLEASGERGAEAFWTLEVKVNALDPGEVAGRERLVGRLVEQVNAAGIRDRCLVHSFDWQVLELALELDPELRRSALAIVGTTWAPHSPWTGITSFEEHDGDLPAAAAAIGAHVIAPQYTYVDEALVHRAHDLGLAVLPWTVNAADDIRAMAAIGVDGIVTDYPDVALAVVGSG